MAHDHQVKESSEATKNTSEASKPSKQSSDIVADWLIIFAKVYREVITPELVLAYTATLSDLRRPDVLHAAFIRAVKICKFRPTPAEVFDAYEIEASRAPVSSDEMHGSSRPKYLDEPILSKEEREKAVAEIPRPDFNQPTRINYEAMKESGIGLPYKR